ncbi:hypothetical protein AB0A73_24300 [Glycomyces sp. NPDC047369]
MDSPGPGFANDFHDGAPRNLFQADQIHLHQQAAPRLPLRDFWHPNAPSAGFVGREGELEALAASFADRDGIGVVQSVGGIPGVGKTQLAAAYLRTHRDDYPDGRIFYDFQSYAGDRAPETADDALLQILPVVREDVSVPVAYQLSPEGRLSLWRESVADRRLIMVWDNVKRADQVAPLLVRQPGCATIVTSRDAIDIDGAAPPIRLDVMDARSALRLFHRIAGTGRHSAQVPRLIEYDRYLPLLIKVHAEAVRSGEHRLDEILYDLQANPLGTEPLSQERLFARLDGSYHYLEGDQRRAFRALGAHPGKSATVGSLAAVLGFSEDRVRAHLDALVKLGLAHRDQQPAPSPHPQFRAYSAHDLLRAYGAHRAAREGDRDATRLALCAHYRKRLKRLGGDRRAWLEAEAGGILATALIGDGPEFAELALAAGAQFYRIDRGRDAERAYEHAARCFTALDDQRGLVRALRGLGDTSRVRDFDRSRDCYRRAAAIHAQRDDLSDLAHAHRWIGDVETEWGHYGDAVASYERAAALYREHGDPIGLAHALRALGNAMAEGGDPDAAERFFTAAADAYGDKQPRGTAQTLRGFGDVAYLRGDFATALARYRAAADVYAALDDEPGTAHLRWQARAALASGDPRLADDLYNAAAAHYQTLGDQFGLAKAWQGLGTVATALNDPAAATRYLTAAAHLFGAIGEPRQQAKAQALKTALTPSA